MVHIKITSLNNSIQNFIILVITFGLQQKSEEIWRKIILYNDNDEKLFTNWNKNSINKRKTLLNHMNFFKYSYIFNFFSIGLIFMNVKYIFVVIRLVTLKKVSKIIRKICKTHIEKNQWIHSVRKEKKTLIASWIIFVLFNDLLITFWLNLYAKSVILACLKRSIIFSF